LAWLAWLALTGLPLTGLALAWLLPRLALAGIALAWPLRLLLLLLIELDRLAALLIAPAPLVVAHRAPLLRRMLRGEFTFLVCHSDGSFP
jgi:hypothetical protein